jgi:hypothetical protein
VAIDTTKDKETTTETTEVTEIRDTLITKAIMVTGTGVIMEDIEITGMTDMVMIEVRDTTMNEIEIGTAVKVVRCMLAGSPTIIDIDDIFKVYYLDIDLISTK